MSRLPEPGADEGAWGAILNDFLSVSHGADGTLQPASVVTAIPSGSIAGVKLQDSYLKVGQLAQPNGVASLGADGLVPTSQLPVPTPAIATPTTEGVLQLAGDLGGTAAAPTVPGLANKAATATAISAGVGLTGGGNLSASRTFAVNFGTTAGTVTQGNDSRVVGAEQTANKGVASGYAALDATGKVPGGQLPPPATVSQAFSSTGTLMVEAGTHRLYNNRAAAWTISGVRASVGTAPTGSAIIVDVNVNGTTIFTTQANRPTIATAAQASSYVTNMDITTVAPGAYITIDVAQVGSTIPGADLTVQLEVV